VSSTILAVGIVLIAVPVAAGADAPLVAKAELKTADLSSLVVHAQKDDDVTDPAGNAGARIACGVVVKT